MTKSKIIDKTFCDFSKKDIEKYDQDIRKLLGEPKYFCKKCLRASAKKNYLCKPEKL